MDHFVHFAITFKISQQRSSLSARAKVELVVHEENDYGMGSGAFSIVGLIIGIITSRSASILEGELPVTITGS